MLRRRQFRLALLATFIGSSSLSSNWIAWGQDRPIPEVPVLAEASSDATNAIGSFKFPKDLKCDLFAAEPMVGNPVAFTIDASGRVLVCESYRQNRGVTDNRGHDDKWLDADLAAQTVQDRIAYHRRLLGEKINEYQDRDDVLRLLVDTDGDHRADKATVFASGFNGIEEGTGAGALFRDGHVYYTNIPKLWMLTDKDNDGVADERKSLADGFGVRVAFRGHDMHGLVNGPDGRIYFSIGDRGYHVQTPDGLLADPESGAVFRCEPDGSHLEIFASGLRNPQELAFDDFGNLFTGDNNSDSGDRARWVNVVRGGDTGWRMMYQYLPDRGPFNRERIWYPFDERTPAYIVPPIANIADGPSGLAYYPGTGLSNEYQNTFFLVDFRGQASNSGVRTVRVAPKGAFFSLESNEQFIWNLLGTDVEFGPDGGIYVSDWVNGWNGENKGRIYRFFDPSQADTADVKSTREILKSGMASRGVDEVASLMSHPDRRVRFEAQWELVKRNQVAALSKQAMDKSLAANQRLHGVWGLGQVLRATPTNAQCLHSLVALVSDEEPWVASRAIESIADGIASQSDSKSSVEKAIVDALSNSDARVQAAACLAVERLKLATALPSVVRVLEKNNDQDPVLRHAGIMAMTGMPDSKPVVALKQHASRSVRVAAAVALRRTANPAISQFLNDASIEVVREAARGIHDVPALHSQLEALAERITALENDDAIVRRVLDANFRLGKSIHAQRLAKFAASAKVDDVYRIEALDMLATWGKPGARDRVMNRHLPLADRNSAEAIDALRSNLEALAAAPAAVRDRFMVIGSNYKISEIAKTIEETYRNTTASPERRATALRALANINESLTKELLQDAFRSSNAPLRIAALTIQAKLAPEKTLDRVKTAMQSKEANERQAAWDVLGELPASDARTEVISQAITDYLQGKLPRDVRLNAAEAIRNSIPNKQREAWNKHQQELEGLREEKPVEYYADSVEGGNVEAGKVLFFTKSSLSCVRCHKVGNTGGEVGPNLSEIGTKKSSDYLLEAIVAPNKTIAEGFKTINVQDEDGAIHSGILKSEDADNLVLLDAQGNLITIPADEVVARRDGQSSMPVDLMKYLNRRELRDLVAYLKSLDGSPNAISGMNEGGHKVE